MPSLEDMAARLRQQFPRVKANAYSGSVGSRTSYQGHDYGVDCFIPDAPEEDSDNIALTVDTGYLTTVPCINASVCGGQLEAMMFQDSQPLTEETLGQVLAEMPRLYQALQAALAKRSPLQR